MNPDDILRLANRIERLERTSTSGWHPADELDLKNALSGRGHRKLPSPKMLREMAAEMRETKTTPEGLQRDYQTWIRLTMDMESLIHRNRPGSPQRLLRDMQRGKFPGFLR